MRARLLSHALAIAAVSSGLAGCAARTTNPEAISDALTAARIRTALVNDPQLGARTIDVRVTAGVAHVNGGPLTEEEAARLQQLVRAVAGVNTVEATVEVVAAPRDPHPAGLARVKPAGHR